MKNKTTPIFGGGGQTKKLESKEEKTSGRQAFNTSLRDKNNSKIIVLKTSKQSKNVSKKIYLTHILTYLHTNFKKAFTLAEVLITLGIIGIVAALTMPSLIAKYTEQAEVAKVKKFYSVFSQAMTRAVLENGTVDNWGLEPSELAEDEEGNLKHSEASVKNYDLFMQKLKPYLKHLSFDELSDKTGQKGFVLSDGTSIVGMWFYNDCNTNSTCGDFYFRTKTFKRDDNYNSHKSGDTFAFYIYKDRIVPMGIGDTSQTCIKGTNLTRCTGWVITYGNMDYLHCPEKLSWNGKTSCK